MASDLFDQNGFFSLSFLEWLSKQQNAVLFETTQPDAENRHSYVFLNPESVIKTDSLKAVDSALAHVDKAIKRGRYVAGYLAYEAGAAFEPVLQDKARTVSPLLWLGVYKKPIVYNHRTKRFEAGGASAKTIQRRLQSAPDMDVDPISPVPTMDFADYEKALQRIQEYIVAGDTYQVNYTFKLKFPWKQSPAALYARLRNSQKVGYSVFLSTRDRKVLSISPELFFRLDGSRITVKPMKGTAPRGRTPEEDAEQEKALRASEKNRAENLMIVDMLRNDLGRIAKTGSVKVASLFDVERYETVFQATSTIEARVRPGVTSGEMLKSLFPCGSVTGAPKIRTMQIIRELETEPRGIYTGSLGFFAPRKAVWNVAIRTVVLDTKTNTGEMGVGGGVVHDSVIESEYQESLLKGRFLTESHGDFELIETLRWEPKKGFPLLAYHLKRLERSARYFGFAFKREKVVATLRLYEKKLRKEGKGKLSFRVRLLLSSNGGVTLQSFRLEERGGEQHARFSQTPTDSRNRFLFHKTTNRVFYDRELERAVLDGYFDVLFLNEREEITEGARSNIVIKKGNEWFTPPLDCGVLPGVYREYLLRSKTHTVQERVLTLDDIKSADEIYLCNAVRGLVRVHIDGL
ncbi:MAG: aminodeoxychorismate synthase component I [Ignavibacteriae bacterium]|nr:aminodeoxychorismate synthase component I [Ignavibacteriota bacterium]